MWVCNMYETTRAPLVLLGIFSLTLQLSSHGGDVAITVTSCSSPRGAAYQSPFCVQGTLAIATPSQQFLSLGIQAVLPPAQLCAGSGAPASATCRGVATLTYTSPLCKQDPRDENSLSRPCPSQGPVAIQAGSIGRTSPRAPLHGWAQVGVFPVRSHCTASVSSAMGLPRPSCIVGQVLPHWSKSTWALIRRVFRHLSLLDISRSLLLDIFEGVHLILTLLSPPCSSTLPLSLPWGCHPWWR